MMDITAFTSKDTECAKTLVKIINSLNSKSLESQIYRTLSKFRERLIALDSMDKMHREYFRNLLHRDIELKMYNSKYNDIYNVNIESFLLCTIRSIFNKSMK